MQFTSAINRGVRRVPTWVVYLFGTAPAVWFFWLGFTNQLGPNPITKLEHLLGELALQLLIFGLVITPLRRFTFINLLKFRRAIGLMAFFYVVLHLLVWILLDIQILSQIVADILKRPYITIGMAAFIGMLPLAVTSNQWSVKKLGRNWNHIHRLTYAICLLGALHFVMLRKGFQIEPLFYIAAIMILLLLRLVPNGKKQRWQRKNAVDLRR